MLEWKEREHEVNDQATLGDRATIVSLRNCRLLKFFMCSRLRAQPLLLQRMVAMWEPDSQRFLVDDQYLDIEIDDIYFLTGLSCRGDPVEFENRGGGGEPVESYIRDLCTEGTRHQGGKLPIQHVTDIPLRTILYTVTRIAGSTSAHLVSKSQVMISIRATKGVVFYWCSGLLANLMDQLTRCRQG
jgi:hypothetical protein